MYSKDYFATTGHSNHEFRGSIAIDFANYLDDLIDNKIPKLGQYISTGWHVCGFTFQSDLIKNEETLDLEVILSKYDNSSGVTQYGKVKRVILKKDFTDIIIRCTCQIANKACFDQQEPNFKKLQSLED